MHVDITDLRLLVAVADANNVTRGAERCHLSAASVSVRIKNIEEDLGAKLFIRSSHGVTLTAPGRAFVHHARIMLAQLEHLRSDVQDYGRGIKGHLRVVASVTAIAEYLPAALGRFLGAHPDVSIDLKERPSPDVVRAIADGKADLGIVAGPLRMEPLETRPYRSDRLTLVVPQLHPLSGAGVVRFEDTLGCDYVCLPEGTGLYAFLMQQALNAGMSMKVRVQIGSFEACCRMIEERVGIGVMPQSAAARLSRGMAVGLVDLANDWALRKLTLCARDFDLLPAFARDLVDALAADAVDAA